MPSKIVVAGQHPAMCSASAGNISQASSCPLDPRRGGPVGALTLDDVSRAVAYLDALFRARGDSTAYANDELASSRGVPTSIMTPSRPAPGAAADVAPAEISASGTYHRGSSASSTSSTLRAMSMPYSTYPRQPPDHHRLSPSGQHPALPSTARSYISISRSMATSAASAEADVSELGSFVFENSHRHSSLGLNVLNDDICYTFGMDHCEQHPWSSPNNISVDRPHRLAPPRRGHNPSQFDHITAPSSQSLKLDRPSDNGQSRGNHSATREQSFIRQQVTKFFGSFLAMRPKNRSRDRHIHGRHGLEQDGAPGPTSWPGYTHPHDRRRRSCRSKHSNTQDLIIAGAQMDKSSPQGRAAWSAAVVVAAVANQMNKENFPCSVMSATDNESLRTRRAAHRLLLAILGFDGAHGLLAVGKTEYVETGFRDEVLEHWTLSNAKLSLSWKAHRAHSKAMALLAAVCRCLQDAVRALDRAAAAAKRDGGLQTSPSVASIGLKVSSHGTVYIGSRSRPSRYWADSREKTTQVSFILGKLLKYDPNLPVIYFLRDSRTGQPASFRHAIGKLMDPLPSNLIEASRLIEHVRSALLDAREVALETLEQISQLVDASANEVAHSRHAKIEADTALIESRFQLVQKSLSTLETDPVSLRLIFEISETMKAQEREAGIEKTARLVSR